ncbi:MAG: DNA processing protein [Acidimicrobiales bacterium]|jgi:DNA processing protein
MSFPIHEVTPEEFPSLLREIPQVPKSLNYRGQLPPTDMKLLAVVGSRKYSTYGKQVIEHLIGGLKGFNIGIVSGLALGVDSISHEAALRHDLYTLAVPGSGVDDTVIYPARHKGLAKQILEHNGGLLSEFEPTFTATKWSFTQRNRIMAGIAHATLMIEATEKSGTLITARMATDYNREVLVVPGNIFSGNCAGTHQFLKLGATPVTEAKDILYALGIDPEKEPQKASLFEVPSDLTELEKKILTYLHEPTDTDTLMRMCSLLPHEANSLLMQMEIKGLITSENNIYRRK